MSLVTTKGMLLTAREGNYAVGAFNANNLEMAKGIIEAAEEENAPVIVQISQGGAEHAGIEEITAVVKVLARRAEVPVAIHLDHGLTYAWNIKALRAGFTSLMFDGSLLSFDENAAITARIVTTAHIAGVPVEAELGEVPKNPDKMTFEELKQYLTEPVEAKRFVDITNVDSLAVAVGSMHKMKMQAARLDIELIHEIKDIVDVPLVLHGASGVTDESVKKAIEAGICKVNIHTHIAKHFTGKVRSVLDSNPDMVDLRKYLIEGRKALKEQVKKKIRLFGTDDKADSIKDVDVIYDEDTAHDIVD